ncbi:MAG TPA: hypothetical protein VGR90_09825 [Acidimicrobiales bacterium]|nr:hypothetical protein [Acidimicrobiales bacterium]
MAPETVHHGPRSPDRVAPRRRRLRHWKLKDWKRRTNRRRRRVAEVERLSQEP